MAAMGTRRWLIGLGVLVVLAGCVASPVSGQQSSGAASGASGASGGVVSASSESEHWASEGAFSGLRARFIGPALMSGRIGDLAVNPERPAEFYVAVSSGNVWKTVNAGITFEPVFDDEGSYSIGCVALDPTDPEVVWVGTGENNSQRSVSWGDGVYKSVDGGSSWEHMGLKDSEHIGMIAVDPRDPDVVYVASQGPLWRSGGDRGLYKTVDGGVTWQRVLHVSDETGINEVHLDPRDPDVLYASAYQRRRHVWTLINGGPEGGLWKSEDAGATWREINVGLPEEDMGRIGLDISPVDPDVVYAIVEAANGESGFYRSENSGETWERMSDHETRSPQYYNEIVCDPVDVDTVYALDVFLHVTRDGGATFEVMPRLNRHVDDHALWINPADPLHMIVGSDGGVYDTYDAGEHWRYKANLPVTQFYRVNVDQSLPFYYVYGGTQDNNTQGGPSRTTDRGGIMNEDWFITVGGDGYETVVDPEDPMVVYSQWQYGGLVRHDRRSGEVSDIRPMERPGDEPFVFNWDTPLVMSPHDNRRLYFAGNFLFRSDDGGGSWRTVSPDLTRGIDRNELEVMGRVQRPDAVAKHNSTSIYGNAVSLDESPVLEGLLYVGTDDGLIHVSEDGGGTWRVVRSEDLPGAPERAYVSCLHASPIDADVVFATFDHHKMGDFEPYVYRSDDRGRTWSSIRGDLGSPDVCYVLRQDHVDEDLLFLGTEYAAYFSVDGGDRWVEIAGVPTIAVQDLELQRRENDVVLGTFGRGIYILDDYTPLRSVSEEALEREAVLFPVKDALLYVERSRLGHTNGRGYQGASFYAAENPPFGAVVTYHLGETIETLREARHAAEEAAEESGEGWSYPSIGALRQEDLEVEPTVMLTVRDARGAVVRRVEGARESGFHRVAWDLRYPSEEPVRLGGADVSDWSSPPRGPLVAPGVFSVTLDVVRGGETRRLAGPERFEVRSLASMGHGATFAASDPASALAFEREAASLRRAVLGAVRSADEALERVAHLRVAIRDTPAAGAEHGARLERIRLGLEDALVTLRGDRTKSERSVAQQPSIAQRIGGVVRGQLYVTSPPDRTDREQFGYASEAFGAVRADLARLIGEELGSLERDLERLGAPWTPGRVPTAE